MMVMTKTKSTQSKYICATSRFPFFLFIAIRKTYTVQQQLTTKYPNTGRVWVSSITHIIYNAYHTHRHNTDKIIHCFYYWISCVCVCVTFLLRFIRNVRASSEKHKYENSFFFFSENVIMWKVVPMQSVFWVGS